MKHVWDSKKVIKGIKEERHLIETVYGLDWIEQKLEELQLILKELER